MERWGDSRVVYVRWLYVFYRWWVFEIVKLSCVYLWGLDWGWCFGVVNVVIGVYCLLVGGWFFGECKGVNVSVWYCWWGWIKVEDLDNGDYG